MEMIVENQDEPIQCIYKMKNKLECDPIDTLDDNQEDGLSTTEKDMEIQFLRCQIQDLQGALKARDMELFTLQERYDLLAIAVEQQDEAIAAIYATTGGGTADETQSQLAQYTALRESTMMAQAKSTPQNKRTAKEMLKNHLNTMGFDASCVGTVLDALKEKENPPACTSSEELAILNSALDQLVCPEPLSTPISTSYTTEDIPAYANTSGFLRRPTRRQGSGRKLSVSDFGLLHSESDNLPPNPLRRLSDPLFAGFDDEEAIQAKQKKGLNEEQLEELSYAAFLERLSLPGSKDIVESIRQFIGSVLGPRGDGRPPASSHFVDYIFYGKESFQLRCEAFFRSMDETLASHPAWRYAPESILKQARDGIEKYVMDKLADIPFHQLDSSIEWKDEDKKLVDRMKLFSFVTPDMLDIKPCMRNEVVWSIAQDELRRINSFRAPGDKINCIVRCCSIIFSVLNLSRGADSLNRPGADDFLPVFIYLVLHSNIPGLYSNAEYIAAYRNPSDLMSKAGYCFVNLRSAIEFISVLDASMLSIDPEEYDRHIRAAQDAIQVEERVTFDA